MALGTIIAPTPQKVPSFSQGFGTGLGAGLGSGLQALAQYKIQQLQQQAGQQQLAKAYTSLGFEPQEAFALASLPQKLQQTLVPAYLERLGAQKESESQLEHAVETVETPETGKFNPQSLSQLFQMPQQFQVAPLENVLQQLTNSNPQAIQQLAPQSASIQPQQKQQLTQPEIVKPIKTKEERIAEHKAKKPSIAEVLSRPSAQQIKQQQATQKAEEIAIKKETQPYVDKITLEKDQADFSQPRLNKMKELIKRGKLPSSAEYKIFKSIEDHITPSAGGAAGAALGGALGAFGGPVGGVAGGATGAAIGAGIGAIIGPIATMIKTANKKLFSTDEEAFEKLSTSFLRGMKDIFGARISNAEMTQYLASIPTLNQTDQGKLAVIEDMELFNKASSLKYKAMQQIIKENGGKRPINLREQVEERVKPQLDKLSDVFREDL